MNAAQQQQLAIFAGIGIVAFFVIKKITSGLGAFAEQHVGDGGTQQGGILAAASRGLLGDQGFTRSIGENEVLLEDLPLAPAPRPSNAKSPIDYISGGFVVPRNGGTVQRAVFSDTVRIKVQIANTGPTKWHGALKLDVHEDYLLNDQTGSTVIVVDVGPYAGKLIEIDYALVGGGGVREPNLFFNMFAGTKHLTSSEVRVT